jgi:hypothetical protein
VVRGAASKPRSTLLHPPPVGVTISIASPASTLASAQPDRISMLPSLRRTELRPGPTPACAQTWDNARPAAMSPRSAGKGTDSIAYWIRRYFIGLQCDASPRQTGCKLFEWRRPDH